jgi:Mg-chelatase subunit ChlD
MSERASNGTEDSGSQQQSVPVEAAVGRPRARRKAFATYALVVAGLATAIVAIAHGWRTNVAVVAAATTTPAVPPVQIQPPPVQPSVPAARPRVEMVFVLDTTSSMSGLIEGAKRKIWSLASFVAHGQPTPELRVGLVAFRDVGDAYVTRVHDLDDDLDRVYARLRRFRAEGGGDTPEHVARALDEAVQKMSWSDQQSVVKVIYLVGDAPPHTDYDDGYDLKKTARAAVDAGIAVHTIRCGDDAATEAVWRTVASIGHGQFMTVGQDGGMREAHTPFDDELARLHDKLSNTTIAYGAGAAVVRAAVASAAARPPR